MYVVIVGGGKVGYYLTRELLNQNYEVLLIEKDRSRLTILQEELGEVAFYGDGAEIRDMEMAGFERADVVVSVTGDDEDNLVICQMAKKRFNVPRVIARVNDPENMCLFHQLGVTETLNSTCIIYNLIEQTIESDEVIPLAALQQGKAEIVEVNVSEASPLVGKRIGEIVLPGQSLIIAVIRGGQARIPTADTVLSGKDTIIILVDSEHEALLNSFFADLQNVSI